MKQILFSILFLSAQFTFAQPKLPFIKATSKTVAINDGGYLDKNAWNLSPTARPDIFTADRTRKTKWVTFYTDIDSIRIKVTRGSSYDFVILLNEKDSCYIRVKSAIPAEIAMKNATITRDTIPFILTSFNAIRVKAIVNNTDTLSMHFDLSSYDFALTKDAILKKTRLLSNQPDALTGKVPPNYNKLNKVSKLQIGNIIWNNPGVRATDFTAREIDGRIGWNVFEGKYVELDYEKGLLIISTDLPKNLKGYVKSNLDFIRSYPCITGNIKVGNNIYPGAFMMDTGSSEAMILDSAWAGKANLPKDLKVVKTTILKDPRGNKYEVETVLAPNFQLNGFPLINIPALKLGRQNPAGFSINFLGNDVLKRFNMVLDLKHDCIYLKPNFLTDVKYRENTPS